MKTLVLLLAMVALLASPAGAEDLLVGVLEHPQCNTDPVSAVRPLFRKQGQQWIALSSKEASRGISLADVSWNVAFDGRRLGSVKTVDPGFSSPYAWTYPRDRLLALAPDQPVPAVANGQRLFGGWCDAPSNRPLVVVSQPNFLDPQAWKRFEPDPTLRGLLFSQFAAVAGKADTCTNEESEKSSSWAYTASDLIMSAGYQDRTKTKLISVALNPTRSQCDGPPDTAWLTHWFMVTDSIRYLGENLSLVDAGDYDADGASELLFWFSGYNKDGYSLFYEGLQKRVDYQWSYH